ncbi:PIN domain-containing protein [Pectobacterium sp. CHL-2024]|uniref:PIN domain-containing protein n=1 Tax=Pectobacterium sp. CHL-2024 TaxID=3377079 RepID=UPI0037F23DE4
MKSVFCGFYSTAHDSLKEIWLSESTLFVFDTNCLLNLYRCEDHTREEIIEVMRVIMDKVWIPFQVGFEFQRNRRLVIEDSVFSLTKIQDELKKIYTQNILSSGSVKKHLYNALSEEVSTLQEKLKKTIDSYIKEKIEPRISSKQKIAEHDFIRNSIDEIIGEKIGAIPTQEHINTINEQGQKRYINKQPPGFKDDGKKESLFFSNVEFQGKFGDLYLWKEIIEKAKDDKIKNVIFVCDDNKNDWWFVHTGKTHGPLEALKTEICTEAKLNNFILINQLTFLHDAKQFLDNIKISESSLKEVEELSYEIETTQKDRLSHELSLNEYVNVMIKKIVHRQNETIAMNECLVKIENIKTIIKKAEDFIKKTDNTLLNMEYNFKRHDAYNNRDFSEKHEKIKIKNRHLEFITSMVKEFINQAEELDESKLNSATNLSMHINSLIHNIEIELENIY